MIELEGTDKLKIHDIMDEIEDLKKYNNELLSNTNGEKLESYIYTLGKSINNLEEEIETLYLNQ